MLPRLPFMEFPLKASSGRFFFSFQETTLSLPLLTHVKGFLQLSGWLWLQLQAESTPRAPSPSFFSICRFACSTFFEPYTTKLAAASFPVIGHLVSAVDSLFFFSSSFFFFFLCFPIVLLLRTACRFLYLACSIFPPFFFLMRQSSRFFFFFFSVLWMFSPLRKKENKRRKKKKREKNTVSSGELEASLVGGRSGSR